MHVVIPKIPDDEFRHKQEEWLVDTADKFELYRETEDDLKRLLMRSKSNVFNLQLKFPHLKPMYDEADVMQNFTPDPDSEKKFFNTNDDLEVKQRQAQFKLRKLQNYEIDQAEHAFEDKDEDNLETSTSKPFFEQIEEFKKISQSLDKSTEEFKEYVDKNIETFKKSQAYLDEEMSKIPKLKEKVEWVEREENEELKQAYDEGEKNFQKFIAGNMKEGESALSFSPFSKKEETSKDNFTEPGVYVLKDGKLVKGEGRKKEEVMFSNWY